MNDILYTFSKPHKSKIALRFRDSNKKSTSLLINDYKPRLYTETKEYSDKKSYMGKNVKEKQFDSIWEAKQWVKSMKDTPIKIHGNGKFHQQYVVDLYDGEDVLGKTSDVRICYIDIEVYSPDEFPLPEEAKYPINSITIYDSFENKYHVAATCDYNYKEDLTNKNCNVEFYRCFTEEELILWTIRNFEEYQYDIMTGFNSRKFDMPYIINRFVKVVGEENTKRLSPFKVINSRKTIDKSFFVPQEIIEHDIFGIIHIDYKEAYEKHGFTTLDSFSLESISQHELGEGKLSYEEEGSLHGLYEQNPQKFVEYNIKDVVNMVRIEAKRKLFNVITSITYLSKCNFDDAMGTTALWEDRLASQLYKTEYVPLFDAAHMSQDKDLVGAYVREPDIGKHGWGVTIDGASLYPNLIIQYDMDLRTHVPYRQLPDELKKIVDANYSIDDILNKKLDLSSLEKYDLSMTANYQFFKRDGNGIMPLQCFNLFNSRKDIKAELKIHETEYNKFIQQDLELNDKYYFHKQSALDADTMQHAVKIMINSFYGAITSKYFKYFQFEIGEAITTTGQLVNKWIGKYIQEFFDKDILEGKQSCKKQILLYGDTDSIFISMEDVLNKFDMNDKSDREITDFIDQFMINVLQPVIENACIDLAKYTNAKSQRMDWERENIFSALLMVAKKKYVMKQMNKEGQDYVDHPKYKIMGMEAIRRAATPAWSIPLLTEGYKTILNSDEQSLQKFVRECEAKFYTLDINSIAIPTGVNHLEKYASYDDNIYKKGAQRHIKSALIYNHLLKVKSLNHLEEIKSGNKIKYLLLKKVNPINQESIGFINYLPKEFGLENSIDKDALFDRGFLKPLEKALAPMNWTHKEVNNIDNYFNFD